MFEAHGISFNAALCQVYTHQQCLLQEYLKACQRKDIKQSFKCHSISCVDIHDSDYVNADIHEHHIRDSDFVLLTDPFMMPQETYAHMKDMHARAQVGDGTNSCDY